MKPASLAHFYFCCSAQFCCALQQKRDSWGGEAAAQPTKLEETPMRPTEHLCLPYQQAIELIGKRWTGVIIMVLLDGPRRFNEIAERLEGASDRMLSERLKELEATAILERCVYPETPVRIEYRLTEKGKALAPVIEAIEQWGHEWLKLDSGPVA
jgi:DNA-binding HxlR family transcriptional regulator